MRGERGCRKTFEGERAVYNHTLTLQPDSTNQTNARTHTHTHLPFLDVCGKEVSACTEKRETAPSERGAEEKRTNEKGEKGPNTQTETP